MTRAQTITVFLSVVILFGMYFGLDTKPPEQQLVEKSRAASFEQTDIQNLLKESEAELSEEKMDYFASLNTIAADTRDDSVRAELYKQLSGEWFRLGKPGIAGYYAEQVAEIEQTEESWSIAGTTHTYVLTTEAPEKYKAYSADRATACFENAISINPENIRHRVNLAIRYVEYPLPGDPMRGISMLLDLDRQYPENASVQFHLGRFAIRTGQYAKAIERLEKAGELAPDLDQVPCYLAQAYAETGQAEKAAAEKKKCNLTSKNKN